MLRVVAGGLLLIVVLGRPVRADDWTPVGVALWDPVGLRGNDDLITGVSLNVLYGHSHAMYGIEAGLVNVTEQLGGIQLGGFGNIAADAKLAIQGSVLGNEITRGTALQIAGLVNVAEKSIDGIQISPANIAGTANAVQLGFINNVEHDARGLQIGLINLDGRTFPGINPMVMLHGHPALWVEFPEASAAGIQIAIVNRANLFTGVQLGLVNLAPRSMAGLQIAAFNSADVVRGAQIGAANIAQEVHGLQVGLINYARSLHGLQLGAINVAAHDAVLPITVLVNAGF